MTFEIKLKAGFFKTLRYCLAVDHRQILLTPQDDSQSEVLLINDYELKSIYIVRGSLRAGEIEIVTQNDSYLGNFASHTDMEEVYRVFAREFGKKTVFQ